LERAALVEGGIEADGGTHDAKAVRADQADVVAARSLQHFLFQRRTCRTGFAESGDRLGSEQGAKVVLAHDS